MNLLNTNQWKEEKKRNLSLESMKIKKEEEEEDWNEDDLNKKEIHFSRLLKSIERKKNKEGSNRFNEEFNRWNEILRQEWQFLYGKEEMKEKEKDYQRRMQEIMEWMERGNQPSSIQLSQQLFSSSSLPTTTTTTTMTSNDHMNHDNHINNQDHSSSSSQLNQNESSSNVNHPSSQLNQDLSKRKEDRGKEEEISMDSNSLRYRGKQSSASNSLKDSSNEESGMADLYHERIEANRRRQEEITEDMVLISGVMKESARSMNQAVTKDNQNLALLNSAVDSNLNKVKIENNNLTAHSKGRFSWTLTYWMLMVVVGIIFMTTYMFMKIFPK